MDINNLGASTPQQPPYVAPQPQQPQQPQQYSNEAAMTTTAGNETATQITLSLDNEAFKILTEASGLHAESIVNLGIKLFAKTNIYKEFMLKPDFKTLTPETEDLITAVDISVSPAAEPVQSSTTKSASTTAPAAPAAGGFASW
jgi:hypothetical protein